MISERRAPKVAALDGKIYVFGGNKEVLGEVFQPCPDSFEGQSRPLSSPIPSPNSCDIVFVVAIEKERKIVVGVNDKTLNVFVYDVVEESWVKHDTNFCFNLSSPLCQLMAVGSCLYWLDKKMRAYDLDTKQYYEGPIEDCLFQHLLETPEIGNMHLSLLHLAGDFFCVTWVGSTVLHCTIIEALRTTTKIQGNCFKLHTTVISCQGFDSCLSPHYQDRALIL